MIWKQWELWNGQLFLISNIFNTMWNKPFSLETSRNTYNFDYEGMALIKFVVSSDFQIEVRSSWVPFKEAKLGLMVNYTSHNNGHHFL
jgi:hypothetical protein